MHLGTSRTTASSVFLSLALWEPITLPVVPEGEHVHMSQSRWLLRVHAPRLQLNPLLQSCRCWVAVNEGLSVALQWLSMCVCLGLVVGEAGTARRVMQPPSATHPLACVEGERA